MGSPPVDLRLRRATPADADLVWRWVNDPGVRAASFRPDPIPWDDHERWFAARLADPASRIWLLERDATPVGQVRYERSDRVAEIDVSVDREHRSGGLGTRAIGLSFPLACEELGIDAVVAHVLHENEPSLRTFLRAGFVLLGSVRLHGRDAWSLERRCRG